MSATAEQTKPDVLTRELWHVAGTGDVDRLEQILAQGVDVNASDRTGVTALMRAAYHGELPIIRALIEHGADLDAKDSGGLTALMMAKHSGRTEIVDTLLSSGATENAKRRVHKSLPVESELEEPAVAVTSEAPQTRTLQEPPEIWELVHTTHADSAPETPSTRKYSVARTLILAICLLIVAVGATSGVFMLWKSVSANDSRRREVAASERAKAPANQPAVQPIQNALSANPPRVNSKSTQPSSTKSASENEAVRPSQPATPQSAQVAMPVKKTSAKTEQSAENSRASDNPRTLRSNRSENLQKSTARIPRSNSDKSANAANGRSEAIKTPSPQVAVPKANAPKPKVIQWP